MASSVSECVYTGESREVCEMWKTSKTYNNKKCVFLYKNQLTQEYSCVNKHFILSHTSSHIIGQFISTSWFKIHVDTSSDFECIIAWVNVDIPCRKVEQAINRGNYDILYNYIKHTICSNIIKNKYESMINSQERPRSVYTSTQLNNWGFTEIGFNNRLCYDPSSNKQSNYKKDVVIMSLPNFEFNRSQF